MATLAATAATALTAVGSSSIGTAASVAGTAFGAISTLAAGNQAKADARFQARQLEQRGKAEFATKQREALEIRRQRDFLLSRQQAAAADGNFGALDDTVLDLAGDIYQESGYREDIANYEGKEAKTGRNTQAASALLEGKQRQSASRLSAAGTILGGIGKYARSRGRSAIQSAQLTGSPSGGSFRFG